MEAGTRVTGSLTPMQSPNRSRNRRARLAKVMVWGCTVGTKSVKVKPRLAAFPRNSLSFHFSGLHPLVSFLSLWRGGTQAPTQQDKGKMLVG